jgi:hypothetical protein
MPVVITMTDLTQIVKLFDSEVYPKQTFVAPMYVPGKCDGRQWKFYDDGSIPITTSLWTAVQDHKENRSYSYAQWDMVEKIGR